MNTIDDIVSGLCLRKRLDIVSRWDDYMHFVYEEGYDGIDEMLQSHNSNKLISKLRKEYPKYVNIEIDPDTASGGDNEIIRLRGISPKDKKFLNIIQFFNYCVTGRDNLGWLYIEPRYTEKVILPASSHGCVYHITKRENLESITRRGLRVRSDNQSRSYPERIYFFTCPPDQVRSIASKVSRMLYIGDDDLVVLKVNTNSHHIDFYKDTAMGELMDYSLFAYENIPAEIIKVMNF